MFYDAKSKLAQEYMQHFRNKIYNDFDIVFFNDYSRNLAYELTVLSTMGIRLDTGIESEKTLYSRKGLTNNSNNNKVFDIMPDNMKAEYVTNYSRENDELHSYVEDLIEKERQRTINSDINNSYEIELFRLKANRSKMRNREF